MNEQKYKRLRAQDRIKRIKGFYIHLIAFVIVMVAVLILGWKGIRVCFICFDNANAYTNILSFTPWALGLLIHGAVALGKIPIFNRWEERKMREFMEK